MMQDMYQAKTLADIKEFYNKHLSEHTPRETSLHYRWILKLMHPKLNARFLDVACGAGFMVKEAKKAGLEACGIDVSEVAVKLAKENAHGANILLGDGETLPWPDNYFDYVTSLGSLEHYLHQEIGIREIRRVLKPDGLSCIMVPNSFSLKDIFMVITSGGSNIDEQEVVSRLATKNEWIGLIEKNAFKITKTYKCNEFHPLFKRGTLKIKSLRKFGKSLLIKLICPLNLAEHFVFLVTKN